MRLVAALACALWTASAAAQTPGGGMRYVDLAQSAKLAVIGTLVDQGDHDQAQFLPSNSYFDEGDLGYVAALLQARVFRVTGRMAEAQALFPGQPSPARTGRARCR